MNLNQEAQIPLDKVCFTIVSKTRNLPFHHFFWQCSLELDYKPEFRKGNFSKQVFTKTKYWVAWIVVYSFIGVSAI